MSFAAAGSGTNAGTVIFSVIMVLVALGLYFLPTIIARGRRVPNIAQVALVNFFFGWSVIGWIIALIMAAKPLPPAPPPVRYDGGYGR